MFGLGTNGAAVAAVLGAWSLLAGWAGPLDAPPALVMGVIYVSIVGGVLGIGRLTGGRSVGRRLQFSLDEVYTAVTLICVAFGVAVNFDWRLPENLLLPTIVWSSVMAMITAGCLGVLRKERSAVMLLAVLVACSLLIDPSQLWAWGIAGGLATALLIGSLMVMRVSGGKSASGVARGSVGHVKQI